MSQMEKTVFHNHLLPTVGQKKEKKNAFSHFLLLLVSWCVFGLVAWGCFTWMT